MHEFVKEAARARLRFLVEEADMCRAATGRLRAQLQDAEMRLERHEAEAGVLLAEIEKADAPETLTIKLSVDTIDAIARFRRLNDTLDASFRGQGDL